MNIDETLLRAYVDGELDPPLREQVEAVLAHDAGLREQADALRASCLPYRAAHEAQALPPVPQGLVDKVTLWSSLASGTAAPAAVAAAPDRRRWLRWSLGSGAGMAASFFAGWMLPRALLGAGTSGTDAAMATDGNAPWVAAIVGYHTMYVRATVEAEPTPAGARWWSPVLQGFPQALQARLQVPDLASAGLRLRRVQQLGFEGAPLLQMVYLPDRGLPAALCVLPVVASDAPVKARLQRGLGVVAWVDRGLAWVLVADEAPDALASLAARIRIGEFKTA